MSERAPASRWFRLLRDAADPAAAWVSIRDELVAARSDDVPRLLSALNRLVEVESFAAPELQRLVEGWLRFEANGGLVGSSDSTPEEQSSANDTRAEIVRTLAERDRSRSLLKKLTLQLPPNPGDDDRGASHVV